MAKMMATEGGHDSEANNRSSRWAEWEGGGRQKGRVGQKGGSTTIVRIPSTSLR